ncbi:MAG: hypothetical protein WBC73_14500 [Phormidesmis sp.]
MPERQISIVIKQEDALTLDGDVLALKYANGFYGLAETVFETLAKQGADAKQKMPQLKDTQLFRVGSELKVKQVMFVGVGNLYDFQYREIREFSRLVLSSLAVKASETRRLIVTLHGVGYGLDEIEVLESEVAGFIDGINTGDYPKNLESIVISERSHSRALRLQAALKELLPEHGISVPGATRSATSNQQASTRLQNVGYQSSSKAHVFVAMPFAANMDDTYHYGIQGAVKAAGFICERADLSSFTGDVLTWVKHRIDSATLVIADLTGANANVYLEVGYAWGRNRQTVLLIRDTEDLKFDVQGQKCILYKNIQNLEDLLRQELEGLKQPPVIAQVDSPNE